MAVFAHMQFMPSVVDHAFKTLAATVTVFGPTLRFFHPPKPPSQEPGPAAGADPDQEPAGPDQEPGVAPDQVPGAAPDQVPGAGPDQAPNPQPAGEAVLTAAVAGTELAQLLLKSTTAWQELGQDWACTAPSPRREEATTDLVCMFAVGPGRMCSFDLVRSRIQKNKRWRAQAVEASKS